MRFTACCALLLACGSRSELGNLSATDPPLRDVWGSARDDVWAVGERGLVLHWDGRSWTRVPEFGEAELQVVWGNERDVWIGGNRVLYRMRR